jgi:hypothetical protein
MMISLGVETFPEIKNHLCLLQKIHGVVVFTLPELCTFGMLIKNWLGLCERNDKQ